jgi:hypothetical protein
MIAEALMAAEWKTVQVFISSAFHGMHAERDCLVKVVFPELRERLLPHRIHLVDIDLRWGVTAAQAENDDALTVCLKLIDECEPFFVGILGERHGHSLTAVPSEATKGREWLKTPRGGSMTALEIEHAALQDPRVCAQSFFYFRDPAFIEAVPESLWPRVKPESEESAAAQDELKERIRAAALPVAPMENYPCTYAGLRVMRRIARMELPEDQWRELDRVTRRGRITPAQYAELEGRSQKNAAKYGLLHLEDLATFGKRVRKDLWKGICATHPEVAEPPPASRRRSAPPVQDAESWLAEEAAHQDQYIESRLRSYAPRGATERELWDRLTEQDTKATLLSGSAGSGKSALLCWLYEKVGERREADLLIPHFIGASPESAELRSMLRRICLVLRRELGFTDEVPYEISELAARFRQFIAQIPEERRTVLVIDGLNQLDERDDAQALYWLPRELPSHVSIVLSCIAQQSQEFPTLPALRDLPHHEIRVQPLTEKGRRQIIRDVPSLSSKALDEHQIKQEPPVPARRT